MTFKDKDSSIHAKPDTAIDADSTPEEVRDEAQKEDHEDFVSLSSEPVLTNDEEDASHQIIEQDRQDQEVVVPVMPLV